MLPATCSGVDGKSAIRGGKMSDTIFPFSEERGIAETKLWSAVIANTIREWIHGSVRMQREAEEFLLHDEDDFPTVCCSAGMNPETLRDRLKKLRARADSLAQMHFAKLILGLSTDNANKHRKHSET
jgi:hypothetical protein